MTDFKQLWQSQPSAQGDASEIIAKARKLQTNIRNKTIWGILLLAFTMVAIIAIVLHYQPAMLSTKIGALLVIIAIVMQIVMSAKMIPVFSKDNMLSSSADYLEHMLSIKQKQAFLQTTVMGLYFILLGVGIFLYMFEYARRMQTTGFILTYALTALWFIFSWFYVRPRTIRKQQQQINEILDNLREIHRQIQSVQL